MPPFDREAALKAAEKALKLGKVDAAIAEYVKVVEAQPRDWNSANALGDLYVRAKKIEKGVEQYTRIADHLAEEGFYREGPRRSSRRSSSSSPINEYSLLQSGDLAAKQGTLADAKQFFLQVAEQAQGARRQKGRGRSRDQARHARSGRSRCADAGRPARRRRWATPPPRCASTARSPAS